MLNWQSKTHGLSTNLHVLNKNLKYFPYNIYFVPEEDETCIKITTIAKCTKPYAGFVFGDLSSEYL